MSTKTLNYNLQKPDPEEFADIDVINGNMDIIDGKVGNIETSLTKEIATRKEEVEVERKRIDNILTGTVSTTKFLTVRSPRIGSNNTSEGVKYTFSSDNNDDLKEIKDKNPIVMETNMIMLTGGEQSAYAVPSTYINNSTKEKINVTILPDNEKVITAGQLGFICVMTMAYEEDATGLHDAEMKDARVGGDGTIYDTLGDAIRGQIKGLNAIGLYLDENGDVCQREV